MKAYVSCKVWTGVGDDVLPDAAVLVDGDRIVAAGPRAEVTAGLAPDTEPVDLEGRTVIPGLIDAHVHLQFPLRGAGDFLLSLVEPIEFTVLKAARNAQVYLAAGITSVFDCGCRGNLAVALREAIDRGLTIGPRVVASGLPLSPGGFFQADAHCRVQETQHVYVAGDAGSYPGPDWLPKQAHMAELQAVAAARNLLAELAGSVPHARPRPELLCVIDTLDTGTLVYRSARRSWMLPGSRLLHWAKKRFETRYLDGLREGAPR